jgi:hypothetical protein
MSRSGFGRKGMNLYKRSSDHYPFGRFEGEQGKRNDESVLVIQTPEPGESQIIEYQSSINDCSLNQIDEFFKKPDVS